MTTPQAQTLPTNNAAIWHGMRVGLAPLATLMGIAIIALLGAVVARQVISGFAAQQQAALAVLVPGLALAIIGSLIATARAMRRIAFWHTGGLQIHARAALWTLGATALLIILPVILAVTLPQHPAP